MPRLVAIHTLDLNSVNKRTLLLAATRSVTHFSKQLASISVAQLAHLKGAYGHSWYTWVSDGQVESLRRLGVPSFLPLKRASGP